jgi:hypothetical protein
LISVLGIESHSRKDGFEVRVFASNPGDEIGGSGGLAVLRRTLPRVASEMALHVLAYNLTRVMNIIGVQPLITAIRA